MPEPWESIDGWFTPADRDALCGLLATLPPESWTAHIGVFQGRHLAACADAIRERRLKVLAVDTWRGSDGGVVVVGDGGPDGPKVMRECFDWTAVAIQFGRTMAQTRFGSDLTVITRGSLYAAALCRASGRRFSLVFLDADHGFEHVQADILAWQPLLAPGGVLCGHDYGNPDYPGVARAVDELLPGAACVPGSSVWSWRAVSPCRRN